MICACGCGKRFPTSTSAPPRIYFEKACNDRVRYRKRKANRPDAFSAPDLGAPASESLALNPIPLRPDQKQNLRALVAMGQAATLQELVVRLLDRALIQEMPLSVEFVPLAAAPPSPTPEQWMYHYATVPPHEALEALRRVWGLQHHTATLERAVLTCLAWLAESPAYKAEFDRVLAEVRRPKPACQAIGETPWGGDGKPCKWTAKFRSAAGEVFCDRHYGPGDVLLQEGLAAPPGT